MANINEAYDMELFTSRKPHLVALEENKKVAHDKKKRTRLQAVINVVVYLGVALLVMAAIGYLITGNVRLTEMNKQINDFQTQLNTLQSERVRLETALAASTSAEQINQYAQENGMLPADSNQIYYIPAIEEDLVSVPGAGETWFSRIWDAVCKFLS